MCRSVHNIWDSGRWQPKITTATASSSSAEPAARAAAAQLRWARCHARRPAPQLSVAAPLRPPPPRRRLRYYGLRLSLNGGAGHVGAARAAQSERMCGVRAVGVRAPRARALAGARARGEPRPSRGGRRPGPGRRAAARWPGGRRGRAPAARRSPRHAAAVARSRSRVAVTRGVSRAISANCPDAGPVRVANMPPCRDRWALALGNMKGELRPKSSTIELRKLFDLIISGKGGGVWPTRRSNKNASQKAGLDTHKSLKTRLHFSCPESSNMIGKKEKWGQREEKELQRAETELRFCGCAHCRRLSFP